MGYIAMTKLEDRTVMCGDGLVPLFVTHDGVKYQFDRSAYVDQDGTTPLSQARVDEIIKAPGAIYRKI